MNAARFLRRWFGKKRPSPIRTETCRPQVETLEERALPTTTVFLDFGDGFADGTLNMSVRELAADFYLNPIFPVGALQGIRGPDMTEDYPSGNSTLSSSAMLEFRSLSGLMTDVGLDYDGVGGSTTADYLALRRDVLSIVRRQFEPFDINVEIGAASSIQDVYDAMMANQSSRSGRYDAYVFVTGIYFTDGTGTRMSMGAYAGLGGRAGDRDLNRSLIFDNDRDETAVVFAENTLPNTPSLINSSSAVALANTASHEAGHTLALRHTLTSEATQSDLMQEGIDPFPGAGYAANWFSNIAFFSRFPHQEVIDVDPIFTEVNAWELLKDDGDIGAKANYPSYVTGTGASDEIDIEKIGSRVRVTVGNYRYYLDSGNVARNGILIDAGHGNDRIHIDANVAANIRIRGGAGRDSIYMVGDDTPEAFYRPDAATTLTLDQMISYSGRIVVGRTTVRFEEFETDSHVNFYRFAKVTHQAPFGPCDLDIHAGGFVNGTEVTGFATGAGYVALVPMSINFTPQLIVTAGFQFDTDSDRIVLGDVEVGGTAALQRLTVRTGGGNDYLTLDTGNPDRAAPNLVAGSTRFEAGQGVDRLTATNLTSARLDNTILHFASSSIGLSNLEEAFLFGRSGAANADTFSIGAWNGKALIQGGNGGNDSLVLDDFTSLDMTRGLDDTGEPADFIDIGASIVQVSNVESMTFNDLRGRRATINVDNDFAPGRDFSELELITIGTGENNDRVSIRTNPDVDVKIYTEGGRDRIEVFSAGELDLVSGAETDTIIVHAVSRSSEIHAGAGGDSIELVPLTHNLDFVDGLLIDGGDGSDSLIANDRNNSYRSNGSNVYTLSNDWLHRSGGIIVGNYNLPTAGLTLDSISTVTLDTGDQDDIIRIDRSGVTIRTNDGADQIHVSPENKNLALTANVTITGGSSLGDQVFLYDQNNPEPASQGLEVYTITDRTVTRQHTIPGVAEPQPVNIGYQSVEGITLYSAVGNNIFAVRSTPGDTTLNTAPGINQIFVGDAARGLDLIRGVLTIEADPGNNALSLNDTAGTNTFGRYYDVNEDPDGTLRVNLMFAPKIVAHGVTSLALTTTRGKDLVAVADTAIPVALSTGMGEDVVSLEAIGAPMTLNTGADLDQLNLAPVRKSLAGWSAITLDGGAGSAAVTVNDANNSFTSSSWITAISLDADSLTHTLVPVAAPSHISAQFNENPGIPTPPLFVFDYRNVRRWELTTGSGRDRIDIAAPAEIVLQSGLGADEIRIDLNQLGSRAATVYGGTDGASLHLDDSAATAGHGYDFRGTVSGGVTSYAVGRTGLPGVTYEGLTSLQLTTTAFGDKLTLGAVPSDLDVRLEGGAGMDSLRGVAGVNEFHITGPDAGSNLGVARSLVFNSFESLIGQTSTDYFIIEAGGLLTGTIDGGLGIDAMRGPLGIDSRFDIKAMNAGTLTWAGLAKPIGFKAAESIVGGGAHDHFVIHPGAGTTGNMDGWNGTDTLDFSLWTSALVIDVATRTSPAGSFTSFEHIIGGKGNDLIRGDQRTNFFNLLDGGAGNDILVGGQANDTLSGGAGRDLLLGGLGADSLDGGEHDDILIANVASFAADDTALNAVRTIWTTPAPYSARISALRATLNSSAINGGDGAQDTLTGGPVDRDWFWATLADVLTDRDAFLETLN